MFWANEKDSKVLIVIGRDAKDNENLEKLASKDDIMVELYKENGPTTLIRSKDELSAKDEIIRIDVPENLTNERIELNKKYGDEELVNLVAVMTGYYATKVRGRNIEIKISKI